MINQSKHIAKLMMIQGYIELFLLPILGISDGICQWIYPTKDDGLFILGIILISIAIHRKITEMIREKEKS